MTFSNIPAKQGLYDPAFEHDACGMGFVAHLKGKPSHQIVQQALTILTNMEHRGACGYEENTGDGAGILLALPHTFLEKIAKEKEINLPNLGDYACGMVFLPQDEKHRNEIQALIESEVAKAEQSILGWREVPTNPDPIGESALRCMPNIQMLFIGKSDDLETGLAFERRLYLIRKRIENKLAAKGEAESLYFPSFSSRTIVFKGMLTTEQVRQFYPDLNDPDLASAIAMIHSRFSTNTFPSWERAHPNRYMIHNGEINTMRGNLNWMNTRESMIDTAHFGAPVEEVFPVITPDGSDSAGMDNVLEFLYLCGYSLPHAMMMMVPEPWSNHESMPPSKKAFYQFHSCVMEPWDGPAALGFTDGTLIGATLDRNGLRPSRYYLTDDDLIILASEVGVLHDLPEEKIISKQRLEPGRMLLVDTEAGKVLDDEEIKQAMSQEKPYQEWLDSHMVTLEDLPEADWFPPPDHETLIQRQKAFGFTYEDVSKTILPMARDGIDPLGAMGTDAPLAVLSKRPKPLFNYFKQLFAQVTNPPIDAIREEIVTSSLTNLGAEGDLLNPTARSCHQIQIKTPIISNREIAKIRHINLPGFNRITLPMIFPADGGEGALERALDSLFEQAELAIDYGTNLIILSDRDVDENHAPIPSLLATAGLHHHLIRCGKRTKAAIIVESGEPREVHHFAVLLGYGAQAINPYAACETIDDLIRQGYLTDIEYVPAVLKYIKAASKGVIKVMSKIGISTVQSYRGAQIFEAIGVAPSVINKYFTATVSRIGGVDLAILQEEALRRHNFAYNRHDSLDRSLNPGGMFQWRSGGEEHLYNPQTIYQLQQAVREGDYERYKQYSSLLNDDPEVKYNLRNLLEFNFPQQSIPLDEVEPASEIVKRFKSGAMSYGSISPEAHEALAIAMNRLGGKSNSGEGGEDPARFTPDANGDSRNSAIKQVASGRFGVTSHYLNHAREIQIKLAQGAKPGEGGQLPGKKVYPWIAKVRGTTPGVGLISPPPHHDIYSIEDLAQLIHDLKNANDQADINVKLVAEVGVGTIASGVAKGKADVILVAGHDGGTGASPKTSVQHAGVPWELGLAETHQTLLLNNLRSRVRLETDGKLMTGRDVAIATLLGAEEYGFATLPLVALGCVMMRVCHLDTCPVGIATQNPELRKKYNGDPEYVVNLLTFIAEEMREHMAKLGFRTINDMVGRVDCLKQIDDLDHWKAKHLDLSTLLFQPKVENLLGTHGIHQQHHGLESALDVQQILPDCLDNIKAKEAYQGHYSITNTDRVVGTMTGSEITRAHGSEGLPEDAISLDFTGSSGQSFGAFSPPGLTLTLHGDANDYFGKGLCGGRLIAKPSDQASIVPHEHILIGNVAFFGASAGEGFINGIAGERFCVRNSGADVVAEGCGDHGCEYMTGGSAVILGPVGRNFAAGMSGGVAYVFDPDSRLSISGNREMVSYNPLLDETDQAFLKQRISTHHELTGSPRAQELLTDWSKSITHFIKVLPNDYKRMLDTISLFESQGMAGEEALMAAFTANTRDVARASGS